MKSFAEISEQACKKHLDSTMCHYCGKRPATTAQYKSDKKICRACYSPHWDVIIMAEEMIQEMEQQFKKDT